MEETTSRSHSDAFDTDVLVAGAGPTGLAVALQAHIAGARVQIIERLPKPTSWAPALAVQPRTLEVLRSLGVADELMNRGVSQTHLTVHIRGQTIEGSLSDLSLPNTRFPLILFVPQPEVEDVMRQRLSSLGVEVDWGNELVGFDQDEHAVRCRVSHSKGKESVVTSRFLVGCDGAGSVVRRLADISFPGRSYRQRILVADVDVAGETARGSAHAFLRGGGILFLFPLPSGSWRLIAPLPKGEPEVADVASRVEAHTDGEIRIQRSEWTRVFALQHRLADSYRSRRIFLAGDAAHVHSPAGAQGMNTGIQDGVNLGWKLAMSAGGAPDSLLDTYQEERRPVARQVVRMTGLAFALEVSQMPLLSVGRRLAAGPVARLLLSHRLLLSAVAWKVSGLDTRYRRLSPDSTSCPRPGSRVPDVHLVDHPAGRLHTLLDARGFHLLLIGDRVPDEEWRSLVASIGGRMEVHRLPAHAMTGIGAGLKLASYVLARPDGYVAASGRDGHLLAARGYLSRWTGTPSVAST